MENEIDFSKERLNVMKAIRFKCIDCCGFSPAEVSKCGIKECPLWPYRFGKTNEIIPRSHLKLSEFIKKLSDMALMTPKKQKEGEEYYDR